MEENQINPRRKYNDFYDTPKYINPQESIGFLTFNRKDNNNSNNKYIPYTINKFTPKKFSNSVGMRPFHSIDNNYHQDGYGLNKNYNPFIYNDSTPFEQTENDQVVNRRTTYINRSQENFSPYFYIKNNYNKSQIYNGNTTDEGDSYINNNPIRDSSLNSKKMYLNKPFNYRMENPLDISNEEEQLIIYPEKQYIFLNEKYFDTKSNNEGVLRPKNQETYEIKSIEYLPEDEHKNKSISLGDYILKKGNKGKIRKNKSCINVHSNRVQNNYEIKLLSNKKQKNDKEIIQYKKKIISDNINNINIKKNLKNFNNISIIKPNYKDQKIDETSSEENYLSKLNLNLNKDKGGIINLDKSKNINYPSWKIFASACLIQSWFRSIKRLKLKYKKNLHKIIIIQKVYKMHYKYKILSSQKKPSIYKNYESESNEEIYPTNYKIKKSIKYKNNNVKIEPKYFPFQNISRPKVDIRNTSNSLKIYNKPYISNTSDYSEKIYIPKSKIYFKAKENDFSNNNNISLIAILLIKKILENKLMKLFLNFLVDLQKYSKNNYKYIYYVFNKLINDLNKIRKKRFLEKLKKYNKKKSEEYKLNKTDEKNNKATKYGVKLMLNPRKIKKNKINFENNNINLNINNNKKEENNNLIILADDKKYNFTLKQKFLLKKLFLRIWYRQAIALKNAKRSHKKPKKKHKLLSNLSKYILDKINQEVKRRKMIVCLDIISKMKYPNLEYAIKKIKKYGKVRYEVLNNYASIIQNAFRFYMENKKNENK